MVCWLKIFFVLYFLTTFSFGLKRVILSSNLVVDCEEMAVEPKTFYGGKILHPKDPLKDQKISAKAKHCSKRPFPKKKPIFKAFKTRKQQTFCKSRKRK